MKFILFIIVSSVTFSASAQWYRVDLKLKKKQYERYPLIVEAPLTRSIVERLPVTEFSAATIRPVHLGRSRYSYEAAEKSVIRTVQHNMSAGSYSVASYNFSDLAHLYIQERRFSEAKWYLLQSIDISRRENDHKHTVSNLIDLAMIKANIGDYKLAQRDLSEAQEIANLKGFGDELAEIDSIIKDIKENRFSTAKSALNIAESAQ